MYFINSAVLQREFYRGCKIMKIGIISDSHDSYDGVLKAVDVLRQREVGYVFHAGDIISPFTAKAFAGVSEAKFIAVFGNNDGEKLFLSSTVAEFGGEIYEDCYSGKIAGRRIFMTHKPNVAEAVAESGKYDIVIHGHTHKRHIRKVGKTLVIDPGESTNWLTGKGALVVLELADMRYEVIDLI